MNQAGDFRSSLERQDRAEAGEPALVTLLEMGRLLESEQDARLSAGERNDLRRDHTCLLYMGFTRAGQRLLVVGSGERNWDL